MGDAKELDGNRFKTQIEIDSLYIYIGWGWGRGGGGANGCINYHNS